MVRATSAPAIWRYPEYKRVALDGLYEHSDEHDVVELMRSLVNFAVTVAFSGVIGYFAGNIGANSRVEAAGVANAEGVALRTSEFDRRIGRDMVGSGK